MKGNQAAGSSGSAKGKRSRSENRDPNSSSKRLLANNKYAILAQADPQGTKKEKVPPFYVKGFPTGLLDQIKLLSEHGLKCTVRLCTEGYKLMVPSMNHYKAVQELLKQRKVEYFSHDIEASKPLKVVIRGLPDMETEALLADLKKKGLQPLAIHKMKRHDNTRIYRDQLYLIHLEKNSTSLADLQTIHSLEYIAITWERYRPIHREVTQCTKCLNFGHGARNCHMAIRCLRCGISHEENSCQLLKSADPVCANCGDAHLATSKDCPKRAEFIAIRKKASTSKQPGRRRTPQSNETNVPPVFNRRPIPVLAPLPLPNRSAAPVAPKPTGFPPSSQKTYAEASTSRPTPPGFSGQRDEEQAELYSSEQLLPIFSQMAESLKNCRSKYDQIYTLGLFLIQYGH